MANNELFYRVAREALSDSTTITELVIDLNAACESYLQEADEDGEVHDRQVQEEIEMGVRHAERFVSDLRAWRD